MDFETILYSKQTPIVVVSLNRPQVLNAMNHQLWLDLKSALEMIRSDEDIKIMILTGEGRAFSSGADLKDSKGRSQEAYRSYLEELQEASRKLLYFDKPTIAAINGYALGSGYELALACDLRIVAHEAQIGSPEARVSSSVTSTRSSVVPSAVTGSQSHLFRHRRRPAIDSKLGRQRQSQRTSIYRCLYRRPRSGKNRPGEPLRTA